MPIIHPKKKINETKDVFVPSPEQLVKQVGFQLPSNEGTHDPYEFKFNNQKDNLNNYEKRIEREAREALESRKEEQVSE